jgi:hypothetical protein
MHVERHVFKQCTLLFASSEIRDITFATFLSLLSVLVTPFKHRICDELAVVHGRHRRSFQAAMLLSKLSSVTSIVTKSRPANRHRKLLNCVNMYYVSSVSQSVLVSIISSWCDGWEVCIFCLYPWYYLGALFCVLGMATWRIGGAVW